MIKLFSRHKEVFYFCFTLLFFTGLGQTFFIAQFIPYIEKELGLGLTTFGLIYSCATFLASFKLGYFGRAIDRKGPIAITYFTALSLALALVVISRANNPIILFLGLFLMRGFGQVTLGLVATTTITKAFGQHRGKALTMVALGRTMAEGILPFICVSLIHHFGHRSAFVILAIGFLVIILPLVFFLGPSLPGEVLYEENLEIEKMKFDEGRTWRWMDLLKDRKPLLVMVGGMVFPFVATGLFFHQAKILVFKGWSEHLMARGFVALSLLHLVGNFVVGPLIDKIGTSKILPSILFPQLLACVCLLFSKGPWGAYAYMGFLGLSVSLSGMTRNSFWAEIYGPKDLGRIKGMDASLLVIGTSFAPYIYAAIYDWWPSAAALIVFSILITLAGIGLYFFIPRLYRLERERV